jgi:hypothetical protein
MTFFKRVPYVATGRALCECATPAIACHMFTASDSDSDRRHHRPPPPRPPPVAATPLALPVGQAMPLPHRQSTAGPRPPWSTRDDCRHTPTTPLTQHHNHCPLLPPGDAAVPLQLHHAAHPSVMLCHYRPLLLSRCPLRSTTTTTAIVALGWRDGSPDRVFVFQEYAQVL